MSLKKYNFENKKLLLAEDTKLNAEIMKALLELVNMRVDWARDGQMACELFEKSAPGEYAVIFMDIQMPKMDGYEVARAIRASSHPSAKTVPIYAMTADSFNESGSKTFQAGMDGHIEKPVDMTVVYDILQKILSGTK